MIKKIFISIIIFALLAPVLFLVGANGYLAWHRYNIKKQICAVNTSIITLNKDNLHWLDDGKELLINNEYFDVIKVVENTATTITVKGIWDKMETNIERNILNKENETNLHKIFCFVLKFTNTIVWKNEEPNINKYFFTIIEFKQNKWKHDYLYYKKNIKSQLLRPPIFI